MQLIRMLQKRACYALVWLHNSSTNFNISACELSLRAQK